MCTHVMLEKKKKQEVYIIGRMKPYIITIKEGKELQKQLVK